MKLEIYVRIDVSVLVVYTDFASRYIARRKSTKSRILRKS